MGFRMKFNRIEWGIGGTVVKDYSILLVHAGSKMNNSSLQK